MAIAAIIVLAAAAWLIETSRRHEVAARVVPLTTLTGLESRPSFSPDGEQVAFTWDGEKQDNPDIYVKFVGSSELRRLTTNADPDRFTLRGHLMDGDRVRPVYVRRGADSHHVGAGRFRSGGERLSRWLGRHRLVARRSIHRRPARYRVRGSPTAKHGHLSRTVARWENPIS